MARDRWRPATAAEAAEAAGRIAGAGSGANRYLVWWESSATGENAETRDTPGAADALLESRRERPDFERGVVIDTVAAGVEAGGGATGP